MLETKAGGDFSVKPVSVLSQKPQTPTTALCPLCLGPKWNAAICSAAHLLAACGPEYFRPVMETYHIEKGKNRF